MADDHASDRPKADTLITDLPWAVMNAALAAADDAILICEAEPLGPDPHPRTVFVSDGYIRMTGYSREEAIGRSPRLTQGPGTDRAALDRIRAALQRWQPVREEVLNYRKDGTPFWVELNIQPVADAKGWFTHWVAVQRDVTARKANEAALERAANCDDLTGLPKLSRVRHLHAGLTVAPAPASTTSPGALGFVAVVDLDHLRFTNDAFGMAFGDAVLCHSARTLEALAEGRPMIVGRVGGDAFVVSGVVENAADIEIWFDAAIGRLRDGVVHDEIMLDCSATIGVATGPVTAAFDDLLRAADTAAAQAKRGHQGSWLLFDESMRQAVARHDAEVTLARRALATDAITPWFQPIIRPSTGAVVGLEALLRIQEGGAVLAPADIAGAEDHADLAQRIGETIMRQVLAQMSAWAAAGHDPGHVSVNVAAADLLRPGYVVRLLQAMHFAQVPPTQLRLEVTERVVMGASANQVGGILAALHQAGVGIVLDDFGTGYASLIHLKSLPLTAIKVDRSFVADMTSSVQDASIVRGIVSMGHALDLEVVAEGVETEGQLRLLRRFGCDLVQGFLFARPAPADPAPGVARRASA